MLLDLRSLVEASADDGACSSSPAGASLLAHRQRALWIRAATPPFTIEWGDYTDATPTQPDTYVQPIQGTTLLAIAARALSRRAIPRLSWSDQDATPTQPDTWTQPI